VKHHSPIPRHPINGGKDLSPTGIGKRGDDIVEAARTTFSQFFNNGFFYGRQGVKPPVEVRC